ncbi:hypothetical protein ACIPF8_06785, partial [Collimonas sp. NPDC087041]|uniref:hypothetical protein n=1 Tax=Collimonas sp. NPDC087041 TaxID=3363960 RepID=UPI003829C53F
IESRIIGVANNWGQSRINFSLTGVFTPWDVKRGQSNFRKRPRKKTPTPFDYAVVDLPVNGFIPQKSKAE